MKSLLHRSSNKYRDPLLDEKHQFQTSAVRITNIAITLIVARQACPGSMSVIA